jgi:hypothetical protein
MQWLQLTQATTGVKLYVNMSLVVLIAPSKTGGASLVAAVREKESARIIPVQESPEDVMEMLDSQTKGAH